MTGADLPASKPFFRMVPGRSALVFFAGVFFIFAPINLLVMSSFTPPRPASAILINALLSGCIAVSWAGVFTVSKLFIAAVVVFTVAISWVSGPWGHEAVNLQRVEPSVLGVSTAAAIVLGYALFIAFISGQGRRTLRLQTEMNLARQIHETLVPDIARTGGRLEILGASLPSGEMGGDLIDVVEEGGTTDLYLADVSGHGVRAGVVMGMVKAAFRTRRLGPGGLAELLRDLNTVLCETTRPEMFVTAACVRFHESSRRFEYALAGHHPVLHWSTAAGALRELPNEHLPLGVSDGERYSTQARESDPGDLLILYTDGLTECADRAGRQLGHEAIRRIVAARAAGGLEALRDAILDAARAHGSQGDDQTLLLVRIR